MRRRAKRDDAMKRPMAKSLLVIIALVLVAGIMAALLPGKPNVSPFSSETALRVESSIPSTSNANSEPTAASTSYEEENPAADTEAALADADADAATVSETDPGRPSLSSIREQILQQANADVAAYLEIVQRVDDELAEFKASRGIEDAPINRQDRYLRLSQLTGKTVEQVEKILETSREKSLSRPLLPDFTSEETETRDPVTVGLEPSITAELWGMVSGSADRYTVLDIQTECRVDACLSRLLFPPDKLLEDIVSPDQVLVQLADYGFDGHGARAGYQPEPTPMQFLELYLWRKESTTQARDRITVARR